MELVAYLTHKYAMHGLLWFLHYDHHNQSKGFWQKNDSFFLIFALPGWLFIMFGMLGGFDFRMWIGFGILLYGIIYFLLHEVWIHKRFKRLRKFLFNRVVRNNVIGKYLKSIEKAHHAHHAILSKKDGVSFGMLIFPKKYSNLSN